MPRKEERERDGSGGRKDCTAQRRNGREGRYSTVDGIVGREYNAGNRNEGEYVMPE